jgi:hypothetical protein
VSVSKYGKIQTTNSGSIASTEIKPGFHQTKTANAEGSNASWGFMKINYSNADENKGIVYFQANGEGSNQNFLSTQSSLPSTRIYSASVATLSGALANVIAGAVGATAGTIHAGGDPCFDSAKQKHMPLTKVNVANIETDFAGYHDAVTGPTIYEEAGKTYIK